MKMQYLRMAIYLAIGFGIGALIKDQMFKTEMDLDSGVTELTETASILKAPVPAEDMAVNTSSTGLNAQIGGPFTLTDQNGKTVTQDTFKGQYKLVFFGFTYCPVICPTELQRTQKVMDGLGPIAEKIQPIFITVDPERDTPARIKEYLASFHPKQIGLTGTQEQINAAMQAYRIYANKVEMGTKDNYMFDHSAYSYLMGPDDKLISIFSTKDTAEKIIEEIKSKNL